MTSAGDSVQATINEYLSEVPASTRWLPSCRCSVSSGRPPTAPWAPSRRVRPASRPLPRHAANRRRAHWDAITETAWAPFRVGRQWHEAFFETPRSLRLALQTVHANGIAGVGVWGLGTDGTDDARSSRLSRQARRPRTQQVHRTAPRRPRRRRTTTTTTPQPAASPGDDDHNHDHSAGAQATKPSAFAESSFVHILWRVDQHEDERHPCRSARWHADGGGRRVRDSRRTIRVCRVSITSNSSMSSCWPVTPTTSTSSHGPGRETAPTVHSSSTIPIRPFRHRGRSRTGRRTSDGDGWSRRVAEIVCQRQGRVGGSNRRHRSQPRVRTAAILS